MEKDCGDRRFVRKRKGGVGGVAQKTVKRLGGDGMRKGGRARPHPKQKKSAGRRRMLTDVDKPRRDEERLKREFQAETIVREACHNPGTSPKRSSSAHTKLWDPASSQP